MTAVRNSDVVKRELEIKNLQEFYWTDSKRFHTFVANRIARIKSSTNPEQWRHVSSEENLADYASRGLNAAQLKERIFHAKRKWWEKLKQLTLSFIKPMFTEPRRVNSIQVKFSDWFRAVRAVARLKRFIREFKKLQPKTNKATSLEDRREAENFIIRLVQEEAFAEDIQKIQQQKPDTPEQAQQVAPFECLFGLKTMFSGSALHYDVKHPAILRRSPHISALIVRHPHERVQHHGRGVTMNELCANGVWILGCGNVVSSHIFKCVKCRRYRRATEVQQMADLRKSGLRHPLPLPTKCGTAYGEYRPHFEHCFGPFIVKEGRKEMKRYGLFFHLLVLKSSTHRNT
ncbi:hypothetical protein N1851_016800 [Merluccius polli]|uniref:Uncharacterized protein n=1 Tax=Merluccius polli TaxID=89951 RepID=A0AA47NZI5_MERPO|nr:hypothetical protein N1851_016800 [Merluccius polli]